MSQKEAMDARPVVRKKEVRSVELELEVLEEVDDPAEPETSWRIDKFLLVDAAVVLEPPG